MPTLSLLGRSATGPDGEEPMESLDAPDLAPERGWEPLELLEGLDAPSTFVSGPGNETRLQVRYFRRESDSMLVGKAWFGPGAEGPPGMVHGGAMAAVLDEGMGVAAWLSGHKGVAAKITVYFREMLPLSTVATIKAWINHTEGRKIVMKGHLIGPDGQVYSESEGLYIQVDLLSKIRTGE